MKFEGEVEARIWRGRRALDGEEGTWRLMEKEGWNLDGERSICVGKDK